MALSRAVQAYVYFKYSNKWHNWIVTRTAQTNSPVDLTEGIRAPQNSSQIAVGLLYYKVMFFDLQKEASFLRTALSIPAYWSIHSPSPSQIPTFKVPDI